MVEWFLLSTIGSIAANDDPNKIAFAYGPVILAGVMGAEGFIKPEPYSNPLLYNDYYTYNYNVPANMAHQVHIDINKVNDYVQPVAGTSLTFTLPKEGRGSVNR